VAIKIPRRNQTNPFFFGVTGLLVVIAAGWVYLLIIKSVYGRYDFAEILPTETNLRAAFESRLVGIVESRNADPASAPEDTWSRENIRAWEHLLDAMDLRHEIVDDHGVDSGALKPYALLILPGVRALSDRQLVQLKKYVDGGGSVYATGGTGSYDENGDWRGWEFLSGVFGLQYTKDITPDEATKLHSLRGGLPLTAGIPTGFSLKIATWDRPMACEVLERRTTQASTWYNFTTDSGLVRDAVEKNAGIAYGTYGRGRFVWMGFELNSVLGDQKDYIYFDILCRRSIDWLTSTPTVQVRDWPAPYSAAATVLVSCEGEFTGERVLESVIRSERIPVTFFLSPSSDRSHRPPVSLLQSPWAVGTLYGTGDDLGSARGDHAGDRARPTDTKAAFVRAGASDRSGSSVTGALPATGRYDEKNIQALLAAGYEYVAGDSMTDRAVPENIIRGDRALVAFAKTARGDDEVVRKFGLRDTNFQLYTYKEDIDRVLFLGGIYTLLLHSDLQCRPEYAGILRDIVRYLRSKNVFVAPAEELARWWTARNALEVSCKVRSKRRIALVISNPSDAPVANAVVQVNINKSVSGVTITSDIIGTKIPPFKFLPGSQQVDITVPSLAGGASLALYLDYEIGNG
jgi:hypothetical protein